MLYAAPIACSILRYWIYMSTQVFAVSAGSTPARKSSKIVIRRSYTASTKQAIQAIVLLSLVRPEIQPPAKCPLVSIVVGSRPPARYMDSTISYDSNNVTITPTTSLQEDLFTQQVHFPLRRWLKEPSLQLKESLFTDTVKPWKNQTELEKVLVTASAFEGRPGLALTINFSDARRGRLMKDSTTVFRELRNEVSALAKHGPLMMAVETAGSGMLHLHGFLQTDAPLKVIRALMLDIGGRSANVGFRSKQVKIEECHSAICWATYMTKSHIVLDGDVSREQVYFSQSARRVGSDQVAVLKQLAFSKLGLKFDRRGLWKRLTVSRVPVRIGFMAPAERAGDPSAARGTIH